MKIHVLAPLLLVAVMATGCITSGQVNEKATEIENLIQANELPAYMCAPVEKAMAEANVDFARYEASQGHTIKAKIHIDKAIDYSQQMWQLVQERKLLAEYNFCDKDTDEDLIRDSIDQCPEDPEDYDGINDEDGCPDYDKDNDGIEDDVDQCPTMPEDIDGFQDTDGCPDNDNDNDGIQDPNDKCPNDPEDKDGFQDVDGCPEYDNDADKFCDPWVSQNPALANKLAADNVCKGIDKCVSDPEDYDGDQDDDGCPDMQKFNLIKVTAKKIELKQKIFFATNKAKIKKKSYPLLDEIVTALKAYPKLKVRVEGHTDSRGKDKYNKKLSQKRAEAVVTYLVKKGGIDKSRLIPLGWGEEKPIEDNDTKDGRAANRRVEFNILQEGEPDIPPDFEY